MDSAEALDILDAALTRYRSQSYSDLKRRVGTVETLAATGNSGRKYQLEIQVLWDDHPDRTIRVLGSIDDGGLRAFLPLTKDFLVDQ